MLKITEIRALPGLAQASEEEVLRIREELYLAANTLIDIALALHQKEEGGSCHSTPLSIVESPPLSRSRT